MLGSFLRDALNLRGNKFLARIGGPTAAKALTGLTGLTGSGFLKDLTRAYNVATPRSAHVRVARAPNYVCKAFGYLSGLQQSGCPKGATEAERKAVSSCARRVAVSMQRMRLKVLRSCSEFEQVALASNDKSVSLGSPSLVQAPGYRTIVISTDLVRAKFSQQNQYPEMPNSFGQGRALTTDLAPTRA